MKEMGLGEHVARIRKL